jgi:hypothetical protein
MPLLPGPARRRPQWQSSHCRGSPGARPLAPGRQLEIARRPVNEQRSLLCYASSGAQRVTGSLPVGRRRLRPEMAAATMASPVALYAHGAHAAGTGMPRARRGSAASVAGASGASRRPGVSRRLGCQWASNFSSAAARPDDDPQQWTAPGDPDGGRDSVASPGGRRGDRATGKPVRFECDPGPRSRTEWAKVPPGPAVPVDSGRFTGPPGPSSESPQVTWPGTGREQPSSGQANAGRLQLEPASGLVATRPSRHRARRGY